MSGHLLVYKYVSESVLEQAGSMHRWGGSLDKLIRRATAHNELHTWLESKGGRVFSEIHRPQKILSALARLHKLKAGSMWQASGCQIFVFTFLRFAAMATTMHIEAARQRQRCIFVHNIRTARQNTIPCAWLICSDVKFGCNSIS